MFDFLDIAMAYFSSSFSLNFWKSVNLSNFLVNYLQKLSEKKVKTQGGVKWEATLNATDTLPEILTMSKKAEGAEMHPLLFCFWRA